MTPEDTEEKTEPNLFRETLVTAKSTVSTCGANVHSGYGSPLDKIANPLANGGWVCTEADNWIVEMKEQCAGITEAFDEAVATIQTRITNEPTEVPENHYHGLAWPRHWSMRQHNL